MPSNFLANAERQGRRMREAQKSEILIAPLTQQPAGRFRVLEGAAQRPAALATARLVRDRFRRLS
jgi:hypothetical protein